MSSESEPTAAEMQSMLERLISSRNRDLSMFIPFLLGLSGTDPNSTRDENTGDPNPDEENQRDRIVLINPLTQGMVVIEGSRLDSLFRGISTKDGQPPASKSSIDALPRVEITEGEGSGDDDQECPICLEKCCVGEVVKEMPCKHRFHGSCVEKWLNLHGSCPVCRYKMPVEEDEGGRKREDEGIRRGQNRSQWEVWVTFSMGGGRRRTEEERESREETDSGN